MRQRPVHWSIDLEAFVERLRHAISYDPDTGLITANINIWRVKAGDIMGAPDFYGYVRFGFEQHSYKAHRVAWLLMTGRWPEGVIDHIDLDRANNRWDNLRECTLVQNAANVGLTRRNTSGFKGVSFNNQLGRWGAHICSNRKQKNLGLFDTAEAAHAAYVRAAIRINGEFARVA